MRMQASYWKEKIETKYRYTIQISIPNGVYKLTELKKRFKTWIQSGQGFDSKRDIKILLFSKDYASTKEFHSFKEEKQLSEILQLKEIK